MNIIKKVAISILAVVVSLCPTMTLFGNTTSVSAAYISDTDNDTLNIDENKITITTSKYHNAGKQISHTVSDNVIKSTKAETSNIFDRATITISVSSNNVIPKCAVDSFNDMELYVDYYINGGHNRQTYTHPTVKSGNPEDYYEATEYYISFEVITRGESFTYQTSKIKYINNPSCNYASFAAHASGYKRVEAKIPNGENLFISIKPNNQISQDKLKAWAKRMCVYANSLSDITGVKLNTVYILFDHENAEIANSNYGYAANIYIKEEQPANGFVHCGNGMSNEILASIASGNNEIVWGLMHELAHAYAIHTSPSTFNDCYGLINSGGYQFDEYLVNARALTAIQNCDNLRNMEILINDHKGFEDLKAQSYRGKYDEIFQNIDPHVNDFHFYFGLKLVNIAKKYDWAALEKYYAAPSEFALSDSELSNSYEVKDAAKIINQICETSISTSSTRFLKFANTFRTLYRLCCNNLDYKPYKFRAFVRDYFGKDIILIALNDMNII